MRITKLEHSCVLVEEGGVRILIDPGRYSRLPADAKNIDAILITHKHGDHCDIELIKKALVESPEARIITNGEVVGLLKDSGIKSEILESDSGVSVKSVSIEARGEKHAVHHPAYPDPPVTNVGFLVADRFFHPGDSYTEPGKFVEVLALPVSAGWGKTAEAVDFAIRVKPKKCFPIHDAIIAPGRYGGFHKIPAKVLPLSGIEFIVPGEAPMEF